MTTPYRPGRCPDEIAHEIAVGPLDRADWPHVGDEVLYRHPWTGWQPAVVLEVATHDGDLMLDTGEGPALAALDSKHGVGMSCLAAVPRNLGDAPMTSPAHLAVVHVLNDHAAPHPEHLAAQILDTLRNHGWRPPLTAEPIPPAGHSTDETRRRAREAVERAIRDVKVRGGRL